MTTTEERDAERKRLADKARHREATVKRIKDIGPDFPDQLLDLVTELGSEPSALTLEIIESAATGDPTVTMDTLTHLRLKGFRLAMDDFGTGFSSLKALVNSPFLEFKIDKSSISCSSLAWTASRGTTSADRCKRTGSQGGLPNGPRLRMRA